jgi:two-component system chemotaxis response regulator CheB
MRYQIIVIGVSWGGMRALQKILPQLPANFKLPIVIVQHIGAHSGSEWIQILNNMCKIEIKEADEKEKIEKGVYIAPANYHLLIEKNRTFSLSLEERVNHARPSIDVLFECVADVYGPAAIGIILTGLNSDGAEGINKIKQKGGLTIVQDPIDAEASEMPLAALELIKADHVVKLDELMPLLINLEKEK